MPTAAEQTIDQRLAAAVDRLGETANRIVDQRNDLRREVRRMVSVLEGTIPRLEVVHALMARELEADLRQLRAVIAKTEG